MPLFRWLKSYFQRHSSILFNLIIFTLVLNSNRRLAVLVARGYRQHFVDNKSYSASSIAIKEVLIEYYEAALRVHRFLDTKDQK